MNKIQATSILQRTFLKYIIFRNVHIVPSSIQTKDWRKNQEWYHGGKSNECEIYQRNLIEKITRRTCKKTNERIHLLTKNIEMKTNPLKQVDGFEYTEDFDGRIELNDKIIYFNMKMICDAGGAQTRTCREVYHFISSQYEYFIHHGCDLCKESNKIYFVNILDGDTSYKHMNKFLFLKKKYANQPNIFVGDMHEFRIWWLRKMIL